MKQWDIAVNHTSVVVEPNILLSSNAERRGETERLMRQRNCVAGEIEEIDQPFKLALFRNVPFLSISPSHFPTHPPSAYHMSLFIVSAPAGQALCRLDSGSLSPQSHES